MVDDDRSESPRVLEHPVRCEDCANGNPFRRHWPLGTCRLDPLREWPGVKPYGCLYFERRVQK